MDILNPKACRAARVAQGLTQRELADKLGVSQPLISRFESGRHTPAAEVLVSLDRVLAKVPDPFVRQLKFPADLTKRALRELDRAAGRIDDHGEQTIVTMRGATLVELLDRLHAYSQMMCVLGECEHCGKPTPLGTLNPKRQLCCAVLDGTNWICNLPPGHDGSHESACGTTHWPPLKEQP